MPQILTNLRIDEVSAVDKGAGRNVRIVLMKRASRPGATPADTLRAFPNPNTFNAVLSRMEAEAMAKADDGSGETDVTKASHEHRGHHSLAAALDRRREAHGYQKSAKEEPMDSLENILKDYGPIKICKHIVDEGRTGFSEFELVSALTKYAVEQHPEFRPDVAFSKLYESEESIRRACQVAKATFAEVVLGPGMTPQVVTGADARDVDDPSAALDAYARLQEIGKARWPDASEATQFANAFTDPKNAALAQKAHRRPAATTSYPFPR
jgi:hypothetical protein